MKILQKDEQMTAETVLLKHLPKSFQKKHPSDLRKMVTFYCLDEKILSKMLLEDIIDWSTCLIVGGYDNSHTTLLKEVSLQRQLSYKDRACAHLLYLPDSSHLVKPAFDSELESRISSLDLSHAHLVNQTWKFGGDELGYKRIVRQISHFPSFCIIGGQGQPVSWLLLYEYMAMGMLYTLPEHRQKGYATVLVYTMAQKLLAEGYPVFCHVEEDNIVSNKLVKSLGLIEDPSYRERWVAFNT
ncbi:glycine N-acyltransferase-like isoform X2 [Syngnathoides biaculeatus]|uniref:glycine N-acyltransferase-like isoform X2 n=1 Tax=Syngnathoides biaculeatus TaxID=300417 RepID=UPI002ADD3FC5|nr:glycine N-acyltransferase-like isoform X2 [Syngnathoides biaculeatus]